MKLVIINGPSLSGKDKALERIASEFDNVVRCETKQRLHEMTYQFFDIDSDLYFELYNDRTTKEEPNQLYTITRKTYKLFSKHFDSHKDSRCRLSPREAMMYVSEIIVKPTLGDDYFGQYRANMIKSGNLSVDASCGFVGELPPSVDRLGQENILLIRVRGRGEFNRHDSRETIPDGVIDRTVDIWNTGTEENYLNEVVKTVSQFLS